MIDWLKDAFNGPSIDFLIKGYVKLYSVGNQDVWLTTTHACLLVIIIVMTVLCVVLGRSVKKAQEIPSGIQNLAEFAVEMLDSYVNSAMGQYGKIFRNYIGTIFVFIWLSNTSGLFGQRNPTADYGTTLALALITFTLIQIYEIKYLKPAKTHSHFSHRCPLRTRKWEFGICRQALRLSARLAKS